MLNFCLYKPCAMCLSGLHFQPCAVSDPDCNCCLTNKYTYMQLRSPEVTRVNFHLTRTLELHISIFIKQQQQAHWAHPRPGRSERDTGPISEREGARATSHTQIAYTYAH